MIYAPWELFRAELDRNIHPNLNEIDQQYSFLLERRICTNDVLQKIKIVRFMAAYERSLINFLHPDTILKQANIKGEVIYLGSIVEVILEAILNYYIENGLISVELIKQKIHRFPQKPTFKQLIDAISLLNIFPANLIKDFDNMRIERNKVHIQALAINDLDQCFHEEHVALKFSVRLDVMLEIIKEATNFTD